MKRAVNHMQFIIKLRNMWSLRGMEDDDRERQWTPISENSENESDSFGKFNLPLPLIGISKLNHFLTKNL